MPASDPFQSHSPSLESPISQAVAITPDDAADLASATRALHIGTGGDLRVRLCGGGEVTFSAMAAGWHPLRVTRVLASGTSASGITGCW